MIKKIGILIYLSFSFACENPLEEAVPIERGTDFMVGGIQISESDNRLWVDILEEIGDLYGLTRERVRQIKERAIRRLRKSYNRNELRSYLGK